VNISSLATILSRSDNLAWHLDVKPWQPASQMAFIGGDAMSEKPAIPLGWNNGQ